MTYRCASSDNDIVEAVDISRTELGGCGHDGGGLVWSAIPGIVLDGCDCDPKLDRNEDEV